MSEQLERAAALLTAWSIENKIWEPTRLDFTFRADDLVAAVKALTASHWGCLSAITGVDLGPQAGKIEVLYQFCAGPDILTLRVSLEREAPALPSIAELIPAARVLEWELCEMFGVTMEGSSSTHLYLPDGWPERVYPMRKDAVIEIPGGQKDSGALS